MMRKCRVLFVMVAWLMMATGMSAQVTMEQVKQKDQQQQKEADENFQKGNKLFHSQKYEEAFPYYEKAAAAGLPGAQFNLALCYVQGKGVAVDNAKAVKWLERAAQQGMKDAQKNLVMIYKAGMPDVPKDLERASYWLAIYKGVEQSVARSALMANSSQSASAESSQEVAKTEADDDGDDDDGETYETVDVNPRFPGGEQGLRRYLASNMRYPVKAQENNIQGRVLVGFVVNKDGRIVDAKVLRSVHPLLDEEALRLVLFMPKWEPGIQKGKPVRTRFTMPFTFKLSSPEEAQKKTKK